MGWVGWGGAGVGLWALDGMELRGRNIRTEQYTSRINTTTERNQKKHYSAQQKKNNNILDKKKKRQFNAGKMGSRNNNLDKS